MSKKPDYYKRNSQLVDGLERVLFPHQESEEEQEAFTPEGRERVAQWLENVAFPLLRAQAQLLDLPRAIVVSGVGSSIYAAELEDVRPVATPGHVHTVAMYAIVQQSLPYARGRDAAEQDVCLVLARQQDGKRK